MTAYYSENNPYAAAWIRNLIAAGHIAPGDVDERSIADVQPNDLRGYTQCHFFAGIAVWSYALRRAGWPDDREIWSGSPPCQSFSTAGKQRGLDDERHLWPHMHRLIRERRPVAVVGEQVEAAVRHGWLDLVSTDLEAEDYAVGSVVLGAHSVGAPHIRQRLYWCAARLDRWGLGADRSAAAILADTGRERCQAVGEHGALVRAAAGEVGPGHPPTAAPGDCGKPGLVADLHGDRRSQAGQCVAPTRSDGLVGDGPSGGLGNSCCKGLAQRQRLAGVSGGSDGARGGQAVERANIHPGGVAHGDGQRRHGRQRVPEGCLDDGTHAGWVEGQHGPFGDGEAGVPGHRWPGPTNGFWRDADWLLCRDGRWRPVEPGLEPLAARTPAIVGRSGTDWRSPAGAEGAGHRAGRLKGYGNALCAESAVAFIQALMPD